MDTSPGESSNSPKSDRPTPGIRAAVRALARGVRDVWQRALRTSVELFRILIPISIATKLLKEVGAVEVLARGLEPVMGLVGLPGAMGYAWAMAMLTNLYGGMVAFFGLLSDVPLSQAQVTVLGTMMLFAHGLPVEGQIARRTGVRLWPMLVLRIGGALGCGWALHRAYTWGGWLAHSAEPLWRPPAQAQSWLGWAVGEVRSLGLIFLVLLGVLTLMRVLEALGVTDVLMRLLRPVVRVLGLGRRAAPLTVTGMLLGLTYGGGLLIDEARSGELSPRAIFFSLALLSLCHSVIEDTLLMGVLGAHLSGILWARLAVAVAGVAVLVRVLRPLDERTFVRYLCRARALR